jgi:hypothetical protein
MKVDGKKENNFFNILSFIVLIITAVLSVLGGSGLLGDSFVNILRTINEVFILCVLAVSAYEFVSKKTKGWKIAYWIAFAIYVAGIVFIWI